MLGKLASGLGDRNMSDDDQRSFWVRHPLISFLGALFVVSLLFSPLSDDKPPESSVEGGQSIAQENVEKSEADRRAEAKAQFEKRALSHVIEVVEQDRLAKIKRSLLVRLDQAVSMAELEVIGRMLQAQEPDFQRTFIEYLLPGMQVGAGAWATTHFDPDIQVSLNGFSPNKPPPSTLPTAGQIIVGTWNIQADGYVITILKDRNRLILARTYPDGDETRDPVRESQASLGTRYDFIEKSDTGDHFIVLRNGNLEARDDLGQIFVVRPD